MPLAHDGNIVLDAAGKPWIISGPGNMVPVFVAALVICIVLSIAAVGMRFVSRRVARVKCGIDDYCIIPALAGLLVGLATVGWWIAVGRSGQYVGEVTLEKLRVAFITIFVGEIVFTAVVALSKLSILALYWRCFESAGRPTRWTIVALAVVTSTWWMWNLIVDCLQCKPLNAFWNRGVSGDCSIDLPLVYTISAVMNIGTDIIMLCIPVFHCAKLYITRTARLLLCGIFASGFLVTFISAMRVVTLRSLDFDDPNVALNVSWTFREYGAWSTAEASAAVITACLPCFRPLLVRSFPRVFAPRQHHQELPNEGSSDFWQDDATVASSSRSIMRRFNPKFWRNDAKESPVASVAELKQVASQSGSERTMEV